MVRCGPWDGKTKRGRESPERAESGEEFRGEEEEAPERDWISRKGLRGGKGYSIIIIIICYYLLRTHCVVGTMLSICTGIAPFNRQDSPTDEDSEAQRGEVSCSGPHSWHMAS